MPILRPGCCAIAMATVVSGLVTEAISAACFLRASILDSVAGKCQRKKERGSEPEVFIIALDLPYKQAAEISFSFLISVVKTGKDSLKSKGDEVNDEGLQVIFRWRLKTESHQSMASMRQQTRV